MRVWFQDLLRKRFEPWRHGNTAKRLRDSPVATPPGLVCVSVVLKIGYRVDWHKFNTRSRVLHAAPFS